MTLGPALSARARDRRRAAGRVRGRPRARAAGRLGDARLVAGASLRRAGRHVRRRHGVDAGARPAARRRRRRRCRSRGARRGRSGCPAGAVARWPACVLGVLLWHVAGEIGGRRSLPPRARAQAGRVRLPLAARRWTSSPTAACIPATRSRSGTGFWRSSRRSPGSIRRGSCCTRPSVLAPLALLVAYEAGCALFRRSVGGVAVVLRPGRRRRRSRRPRRLVHGARACRRRRLASCSSRRRSPSRSRTSSAERGACSRRSPPRASSWRSSIRPTRSSWLPVRGLPRRALAWRAGGVQADRRRARRAGAAGGRVLRLAAPDRPRHRLHAAGQGRAAPRVHQYAGQLDVSLRHSYRLAPEVFGRAGAVAVVALLFVPLAGLALRRRWAAYVVGGSLAVARGDAHLAAVRAASRTSSRSRSRGGAAGFGRSPSRSRAVSSSLSRAARGLVLPLALAAGIALQLAYPGDFDYALHEGGPALATWIAVVGGVVALASACWRRAAIERPAPSGPRCGASSCCRWPCTASRTGARPKRGRASPLTPGLVDALREDVPEGAVVYSDLETSYRIAA